MHAVFIPFGIKSAVDLLTMDLQCQSYQLPVKSPDGKKDSFIWVKGHLRLAPFGIYEYVFPRQYKDMVLTTLNFHEPSYKIYYNQLKMKVILKVLRKILRAEPIPEEIDTSKAFVWMKNDVAFIPIGIREDRDIVEQFGEFKGWTHEAL
jgi:hypothetical protein